METLLTPCEEKLHTIGARKKLIIGIPKENFCEENRTPITPQGVEVLVAQGHKVVIEQGATAEARFREKQYTDAGAIITPSHAEAFDADVVVKLTLPTPQETTLVRKHQTIVAFIAQHDRGRAVFAALAQKECNIIALDFLADGEEEPLTSRCLGEMEGQLAITTAARLLETTNGGKGVILGSVTGVPPTEVVIVGSGTAALCAARTAMALGSTVKIFDNNRPRLQRMTAQLPYRPFTSIFHPQAMAKSMTSADVLIGTRAVPGTVNYFTELETLKLLKPGAVIVDLDTTFGGRFETSRATTIAQPTFVTNGIVHHCLPDITVLAPHTASIIISDIVAPLLSQVAESGNLEDSIRTEPNISSGTVMLRGICTNQYVARHYGAEHRDIRLLIF